MMRVAFLFIALLGASPADAGCFLFFCSHQHHHWHHHHHSRARIIVKHKTVVKKTVIIVQHDRKAHTPAVDMTPITPLK